MKFLSPNERHLALVTSLQERLSKEKHDFALSHGSSHNTTRTKAYKERRTLLDFSPLDQVLEVDTNSRTALVEPRVTMDALLQATLDQGLMPLVVPEFKGITVGGAIMGGAGESSSRTYGLFHDSALEYELLTGSGEVLRLTSDDPLFDALPGSYGTFGALTCAKLQLMPAKRSVRVQRHLCSTFEEAIEKLTTLPADFIDGQVVSKNKIYVMAAHFTEAPATPLGTAWWASLLEKKEEITLSLTDYLFRYDRGAFWMGGYLLRMPILSRFLLEGVWRLKQPSSLSSYHTLRYPGPFKRTLLSPWLDSSTLWKIHHKAPTWVQERFMVQDFCIPTPHAASFLSENPGIFPIWLCPVKGAPRSQLFSPHSGQAAYINIGMYGIPDSPHSVPTLTHRLEKLTHTLHGRKVLYGRTYYSEEEFWQIYDKGHYEALRTQISANGRWQPITEKVLTP